MKTRILTIALVFGILTSCIVNKEKLQGVEKVAFVSVMLKKEIDMADFNSFSSMVSALVQDDEFDLEPITNKMKNKIRNELAVNMPFELLSEETTLTREGYKDIVNAQGGLRKISKWQYEVPTGYVRLNSMSKKGRTEALRVFPEAQGVMYVRVSYKLHKIAVLSGFGVADMRATMEVIVYNKANKKAMYVSRTGQSEDRIKFGLGGVFDAKKIRPLCEQATEEAYIEVSEYVLKKMKK